MVYISLTSCFCVLWSEQTLHYYKLSKWWFCLFKSMCLRFKNWVMNCVLIACKTHTIPNFSVLLAMYLVSLDWTLKMKTLRFARWESSLGLFCLGRIKSAGRVPRGTFFSITCVFVMMDEHVCLYETNIRARWREKYCVNARYFIISLIYLNSIPNRWCIICILRVGCCSI